MVRQASLIALAVLLCAAAPKRVHKFDGQPVLAEEVAATGSAPDIAARAQACLRANIQPVAPHLTPHIEVSPDGLTVAAIESTPVKILVMDQIGRFTVTVAARDGAYTLTTTNLQMGPAEKPQDLPPKFINGRGISLGTSVRDLHQRLNLCMAAPPADR